MQKKTLAVTGIILGLTAGSFVAGLAVAKAGSKPPVLSPLSEAKWTPLMKEGPLPAAAPIMGDGMKGDPHFSYLKLPAGFTSPPHSHSSDYWSVLVQGKMTHWAAFENEANAKQLGVGDLTFMPAKTEHISKCFPGAECIMAMYQKGKFDFITAKVPPPPK